MVFGKLPSGSRSYISFFPSPSNPPKVMVGLEGVKNQNDPERKEYQNHTGLMARYRRLNGHCSQLPTVSQNRFILIKGGKNNVMVVFVVLVVLAVLVVLLAVMVIMNRSPLPYLHIPLPICEICDPEFSAKSLNP